MEIIKYITIINLGQENPWIRYGKYFYKILLLFLVHRLGGTAMNPEHDLFKI